MYEQIYQYIKDEIRKGNIRPEKQLPSSRELAKSLKVSRSTTQLAYEQLVSEGYLEAVPRKAILRRHWTESFRRWRSLLLPGRIRKKSCLWA